MAGVTKRGKGFVWVCAHCGEEAAAITTKTKARAAYRVHRREICPGKPVTVPGTAQTDTSLEPDE